MPAVGVTDHRAQGGTVSWPCCLPFSIEVAERLLTDYGKDHFSYNPFRVCQGDFGKLKEKSLLARFAFEILEQLTLAFALRAGADLGDDFDQQPGQSVRFRASPHISKSREPR